MPTPSFLRRTSLLGCATVLSIICTPLAVSASSNVTLQNLYAIASENKRAITYSLSFKGGYADYTFGVNVTGVQGSTANSAPLWFDASAKISATGAQGSSVVGTVDMRLVGRNAYVRLRDVKLAGKLATTLESTDLDPYLNTWIRFPVDDKTYAELTTSGKKNRAGIAKRLSRLFNVTETSDRDGFHYTLTLPKAQTRSFLAAVSSATSKYSSARTRATMRKSIRSTTLDLTLVYDLLSTGAYNGSSVALDLRTAQSGRSLHYTLNGDVKTSDSVSPVSAPSDSKTLEELLSSSALNPTKQLADARNAQRRADVNTILNAVYQYRIDNNKFPGSIPTTETEICKTHATDCTGLVNLDVLTESYLISVPADPNAATANSTKYTIMKDANGRITVTSPSAEAGATISVTR